jgi:Tfp pilus assembly protein PilO
MMRTGHAHRFWTLGGALTAAVLLAVGWFFFISPQNARTSALHDEAATANSRAATLQRRLVELRQQNGDLPRYRARLESDRRALPTTSGLADFLRSLQSAGDSTGVSVDVPTVDNPAQVTVAGTQVYALPISLRVTGAATNINRFLDQLQQGQPRAVLIGSTKLTDNDKTGASGGPVSLTLGLQVFVGPATGAGKAPSTVGAAPSAPPTPATN